MTIKKWIAAAALLTMSTGALADGTYVFDSITSLTQNGFNISGVVVGDTVPTTVTLNYYSGVNGSSGSQCFDWLKLMMIQPGMFTFTATVVTSGSGTFNDPFLTQITTCTLTAKP